MLVLYQEGTLLNIVSFLFWMIFIILDHSPVLCPEMSHNFLTCSKGWQYPFLKVRGKQMQRKRNSIVQKLRLAKHITVGLALPHVKLWGWRSLNHTVMLGCGIRYVLTYMNSLIKDILSMWYMTYLRHACMGEFVLKIVSLRRSLKETCSSLLSYYFFFMVYMHVLLKKNLLL